MKRRQVISLARNLSAAEKAGVAWLISRRLREQLANDVGMALNQARRRENPHADLILVSPQDVSSEITDALDAVGEGMGSAEVLAVFRGYVRAEEEWARTDGEQSDGGKEAALTILRIVCPEAAELMGVVEVGAHFSREWDKQSKAPVFTRSMHIVDDA